MMALMRYVQGVSVLPAEPTSPLRRHNRSPEEAPGCAGVLTHRVRQGAAAVEFALVLPFMMMLIMGIIEFGRAIMAGELLANAARTGCRQGVLPGKSTADITSAVNNSLSSTGFKGGTTIVLVNGYVVDASSANTGDSITVTVNLPLDQNTWLPSGLFLKGAQLSSSVVMRRD